MKHFANFKLDRYKKKKTKTKISFGKYVSCEGPKINFSWSIIFPLSHGMVPPRKKGSMKTRALFLVWVYVCFSSTLPSIFYVRFVVGFENCCFDPCLTVARTSTMELTRPPCSHDKAWYSLIWHILHIRCSIDFGFCTTLNEKKITSVKDCQNNLEHLLFEKIQNSGRMEL